MSEKSIKIYGIKTCDSVRKAVKFMKERNIAYELVDFREIPVDRKRIDVWLKQVPIEKLFNTRGTTYRTLKLKELNLDEEEKAAWLARENMLIKRPVIEYGDRVIVGYDRKVYEKIFA